MIRQPILSPTLAANEKVLALRAQGREVYHMGFGQAPFPVHPRLQTALCEHAHQQQYLGVAGLPELCDAVLTHQAALTGLNPENYDVIVGPGSKLILYALQMAIEGDIMLPVPSWVSYAPQARLLGQNVIPVPTVACNSGLRLTKECLEYALLAAKKDHRKPTKLLINFPGNPTGISFDNHELTEIIEWCRAHSITLISDEIYGRLSFDGQYRSASSVFPEGAVVTTGLSKHLSLGGWRLGVGIVPKALTGLHNALVQIASETWSCVSTPVQYAAVQAYAMHADIETFIDQSRHIHKVVNTHIAQRINAMGFSCPTPTGAFYTWPEITLAKAGKKPMFESSQQLADHLLATYGVVTLPGEVFGEQATTQRLRLSGCDYDGQLALNTLASVGSEQLASNINEFAPAVTGALEQLEQFAQALEG